ncbi:ParB/RepB/Spo0J family partition protein [soil metagenome]
MREPGPDSENPQTAASTQTSGPRARQKRSGLGRGLGALIPELTVSPPETHVSVVALTDIQANPYQPRATFDDREFQDLVESVRIHGILQPVIVNRREDNQGFVLIAGERRWRAAQAAGLAEIPAVVKEASPQEMLEYALVENVVRSDLSPLEEAAAYRQLIDDFGLTQQEIAERVGRSRVTIANTLRLLFAPDRVKSALQESRITEGHARALLSLPAAADQIAALEMVIARDLTVRQTEAMARSWDSRTPSNRESRSGHFGIAVDERELLDRLQRALTTQVSIRKNAAGRGSISISFGSEEQLNEITKAIAGESLF